MRGATKPRAERNEHDAYFTPQPLADAICETLCGLGVAPTRVLVPGAGEGAFLNAAHAVWPYAPILGLDIAPRIAGVARADFLRIVNPHAKYSLAVGNPPFLLAEQFVRAALLHVHDLGHVAFLLRLSFLGGQERAKTLWSTRNLRWLIPITPRPSFSSDGKTDASEYGLFVFRRGYRGDAKVLRHLNWRQQP